MGVLEKNLVRAIDTRVAVFKAKASDGSLLVDSMLMTTCASMIADIIMPCCCMLCNKTKLEALLAETELCSHNEMLIKKLALLVYNDLARCNGLG
ncbi:MAG: hypothetical protein Q4D21_02255 [Phascolarctobacterium sp.]|nr:hypothetical protein [Phascolarctobacterium sp.]